MMKWKKVYFNPDGSIALNIPAYMIRERVGIIPLMWGRNIKSSEDYECRMLFRKNEILIKFRSIKDAKKKTQ